MRQLYIILLHVVSTSTLAVRMTSEANAKDKLVPVQSTPIYDVTQVGRWGEGGESKVRMTVNEPRCIDHQQWQHNTKSSEPW